MLFIQSLTTFPRTILYIFSHLIVTVYFLFLHLLIYVGIISKLNSQLFVNMTFIVQIHPVA
jgi:hypothetical protein